MRKSSPPILVRSGSVEFLKVNAVAWDSRDIYHWLLSLSWRRFSWFLLVAYLAVNAGFALLYWAVPGAIAEMQGRSYMDAFFFSVETLATVGYGHFYPVSLYGHLVATAEIVSGMFGMAVVTGLIFVRFARPTANLQFSSNLVLTRFDGQPALMLRVANLRHQPMLDARSRTMMTRTEMTKEHGEIARFHNLPLQTESVLVFPVAMTIRHLIDEKSPLHGLDAAEMERESVRFVAAVTCADPMVTAAVHSQHNYTWEDVRFGEQFVEIYEQRPGDGKWIVDYGRLNETERASK